MSIPKPKGIEASFQAAWAYLTVPYRRGHDQELEQKHVGGDWTAVEVQGGQFPVSMAQQLKTEWRARYTRGSDKSAWTLGRVWMPEGFEEDGDGGGEKPPRPNGLKPSGISGTLIRVDWMKPATVPDSYKFQWRKEGQKHWSGKAVNKGDLEFAGERVLYTIRDLAKYSPYKIALRAVVDGVESEPNEIQVTTTARDDEQWGPATPYNATADTVTDTTAAISWDQDDPKAVSHWQVMVKGLDTVNAEDQEHTFKGLNPATTYEGMINARGWDESYSNHTPLKFTTTGGTPPPVKPKPPTGLRVIDRAPAAGTATVGWNTSPDAEFWRVLLEDVDPRPRKVSANELVFRNLERGRRYGWRVRAVRTDDDGFEHESGWVRGPEILLNDDPEPKPKPPTGLRSHCVTDTTAKIEWDNDSTVEKWIVFLDGDRSNTLETTASLMKVSQLLKDTEYSAQVVAVVGGVESEPSAPHTFKTLETVLPPDDDPPPPDIGADLPAPKGLMVVQTGANGLRADWDEARPDVGAKSQFYVGSVDGLIQQEQVYSTSITFTDLTPGQHTIEIYGVIDGKLTAIARAAASIKGGAA